MEGKDRVWAREEAKRKEAAEAEDTRIAAVITVFR